MGKRNTITDVHRQLVIQHHESGKSYAAIAEAVDISKGSVAAILKKAGRAGSSSKPGEAATVPKPVPIPVAVPEDAPDYDPLQESKRLLFLAERELDAGNRDAYQRLATDARNAYALHVKVAPPDPVPTEEQPDMVEAANQARSKLFAQLARSVARAQEEADQ